MDEVKRRGGGSLYLLSIHSVLCAIPGYPNGLCRAIAAAFLGLTPARYAWKQGGGQCFFLPYLEEMTGYLRLDDASSFSKKLEELQIAETKLTVNYLVDMGIMDAGAILIP